MNNSNSRLPSPEIAFMQIFTSYTPHIIVGVTVLTFLLVGAMQFSFYSKAFENSAATLDWVFGIVIAFVSQAGRFALMTNGANHFAHNRNGKGYFSCFVSAVVTGICSYEMSHLADVWAEQNPDYKAAIPIIVQFVIWLGFTLEIMLLTAVAGSAELENEPTPAPAKQQNQPSKNGYSEQETFHHGNGAMH